MNNQKTSWHGKTGAEIYAEIQDVLKQATLLSNILNPVDNKINIEYLPSYVDDIVEGYYFAPEFYLEMCTQTVQDENTGEIINVDAPVKETIINGEKGKIYIDLRHDKGNYTYRYTGQTEKGESNYVKISDSALENKITEVDNKLDETNNRIDRIESQPNPYSFGPKFPTSIEDEDGGFWDAQYKVQVGYIHSLTREDQGYDPGLYRCIQCPADPFDTTDYKWQRVGGLL